ncbi:NGG1 interacting factor 3 family protein [Schizosaccharomyces cryophilus OY26]|uniref:NGG1 interacting factor 3 family protein n=1 Tax=Schizosaccharomyces cryophilus (strain OY26 / ATCC MYA-4695 / CBS 11777 / NBRC 106824 / NRRL Y48691) TaxID=653667 RepID=S9XBR6_SCHCR|nr:NGG1 interacting factor 3 family protein [Schizosaccharomyces cryophilus OY26]EPY51266.1 NGG1 interacting factor 3 family protein [Schizosaccharomyces cryophilus OY26]
MLRQTCVAAKLKQVVESLYNPKLADSWDNTGLLLQAPFSRTGAKSVLLTIDLTEKVADEAISNKLVSSIITYHPIIFRGLKAITMEDSQQRSLLRLAAEGIHVYSPHTCVDAAHEGVNDWLAWGIAGGKDQLKSSKPIQQNASMSDTEGYGRLCELSKPASLREVIDRAKKLTGLAYVQVAAPKGLDAPISTVSVCAGSGGSVLAGTEADLYFTGELSHHQVLALIAKGISVILCGHSNTERGYLKDVMAEKLAKAFRESDADAEILISVEDRDPLTVM